MFDETQRQQLGPIIALARQARASRIIVVENGKAPNSVSFLVNGRVTPCEVREISIFNEKEDAPSNRQFVAGIGNVIYRRSSNGGVYEIILDTRTDEHLQQSLRYKDTFCRIFEETLLRSHGGLFLLGGPSGSGRSSALLDIISWIDEQQCHQLVFGRPLDTRIAEVSPRKGVVIGRNIEKLPLALESVFGAQVVLIDQLGRPEDFDAALDCADQGTIVIAVASSSTCTVNLISSIPHKFRHERQDYIREQLSRTLRFAATHSLVRSAKGLVMAEEVIVATQAVKTLISERKEYRITSAIQTGQKYGMFLRDERLKELVLLNVLTREEAISAASSPENLAAELKG